MIDGIVKVIPIIFLIFLGVILRKTESFTPKGINEFKKMVLDVSLPCLLFTAFSSIKINMKLAVIVVTIFTAYIVMLGLGYSFKSLLKIETPFFPFMFGGSETGMIGYALFISLFGNSNIDKLAVIDLGQVIFTFTVIMPVLKGRCKGKMDIGDTLKTLIKSPVIIGVILGALTSLLPEAVTKSVYYSPVNSIITYLGSVTVPLICIVIGYELKLTFNGIKLPLMTITLRLASLAVLGLLISNLILKGYLSLDSIYTKALITMFILPPPFVTPIFMGDDRENMQYVLTTISLNIMITLVLFIILSMTIFN